MKKYNLSDIMKNAWAIRRLENTAMFVALKRAWANAKEEKSMENEIKALIEKYHLIRKDGRIGTYHTDGINREEFAREVGAHKAQIIAYFDAQEMAAADLEAKREITFNAIPGVSELRKARAQRAEWKREFNRMMETGSSKMRPIDAPTPEEMSALEMRYPDAVFALEAEYRAHNTVKDQLYTIWNTTYDALRDGQDPETAKADHDARMAKYTAAHRWD